MRRAVVVVLDGMRRDLIGEATTPALVRFADRATSFAAHRSMFPSATRVVSASFATGCHPARHELQGNTLALLENGRLVYHDAGHPDFLQHKRRATGRSLAVPTLAERLAPHGGMILFSNVSPGAAFAHDPDGHGCIYHRAGSFAPGRQRIEGAQALDIAQDAAGERRMTERFIAEVLLERKPALAILWMGEPDATQHVEAARLAGASGRPAPGRCQCGARGGGGGSAARPGGRGAADRLLGSWASDGVAHRRRRGGAGGGRLEGEPRVRRRGHAHQRHLHPRLRAPGSCRADRCHRRISGEPRLGRQGGADGRADDRRSGAEPWAGACGLAEIGRRAEPVRHTRPQLRVRGLSPAKPRICIAASMAAWPSTSRCRS